MGILIIKVGTEPNNGTESPLTIIIRMLKWLGLPVLLFPRNSSFVHSAHSNDPSMLGAQKLAIFSMVNSCLQHYKEGGLSRRIVRGTGIRLHHPRDWNR